MSPITSRDTLMSAVDTDALLLDSYLLVARLRQGGTVQDTTHLTALCVRQIENVREALADAGLGAQEIDHIVHAQCALLDETVLTCTRGQARERWASEPLQARFFKRHQAGESLYENIRDVLRAPATNPHVLTVWHRVLMLGFQGRYQDADHPERVELLEALAQQVKPFLPGTSISTFPDFRLRRNRWGGFAFSMFHVLVAVGVLFCAWWGLDQVLTDSIATLVPGQG